MKLSPPGKSGFQKRYPSYAPINIVLKTYTTWPKFGYDLGVTLPTRVLAVFGKGTGKCRQGTEGQLEGAMGDYH